MTALSRSANRAIARKFPWGNYTGFIDLERPGDLAVQVAIAHPHLRGIGFDLPTVGAIFREHVAHLALQSVSSSSPGIFSVIPSRPPK
jgi:hypothetical protein